MNAGAANEQAGAQSQTSVQRKHNENNNYRKEK